MTSRPNFKFRAGDGDVLVGQVTAAKEMRMFDRLPRSLQDILRQSPVPIMAISAMDTFLETDERHTFNQILRLINQVAPGATPIRTYQSRRRRVPIVEEADAYAVPRLRGRRAVR